MRFGVVVFPGTWSDTDTYHVLSEVLHRQVEYVWHKETDLSRFDCVILPGGFSYGDYLRCGAIARFSPVMSAVTDFAEGGGIVAGICNGFQILCEAGLLPGALMRNDVLQFRCMWVNLRSETSKPRSVVATRLVRCSESPFPMARAGTSLTPITFVSWKKRAGWSSGTRPRTDR